MGSKILSVDPSSFNPSIREASRPTYCMKSVSAARSLTPDRTPSWIEPTQQRVGRAFPPHVHPPRKNELQQVDYLPRPRDLIYPPPFPKNFTVEFMPVRFQDRPPEVLSQDIMRTVNVLGW